jgi:carbon monoxide dehydrogenase subunit G
MSLSYDAAVEIAAPRERVFDAITDLEKVKEWMPNLVAFEKLTPGPLAVGSEWRETRKMMGTKASEVFEVVSLDPPRQIGLRVDGTRGTTGKGEYLFDYRLDPTSEGTRLRLEGQVLMPKASWFARLMSKMMIGVFKKACTKDMLALKSHLESQRRGQI